MNNTITVNIDNLTPEERETLLKLVEKGNTDKKWWKGTEFERPENNDFYFTFVRFIFLINFKERV